MFQDPLVLDIWFLLHMGKNLFMWLLCLLWYPKPLGIFLHNRIGDHTRDVPCFSLGFGGTMCLIFLTCSLFVFVSLLHFIVCSSIDTPLYWFDPCPAFFHCILYICRFLAKSCVHTRIFGQKSRVHAGF